MVDDVAMKRGSALMLVTVGLVVSCASDNSPEAVGETSNAAPTTAVVQTTTSPAAPDPAVTASAKTTSSTTTSPPVPPTTHVVAVGTFQGLAGHRGSGEATLVQDPATARFTIQTTNTDIGSGPALILYLVRGADQRSLEGAIGIADLVAETGDHDYVVPDDLDLTPGEWTVLVWCETFVVEVANATLVVP